MDTISAAPAIQPTIHETHTTAISAAWERLKAELATIDARLVTDEHALVSFIYAHV